jgi:hypothetical protein
MEKSSKPLPNSALIIYGVAIIVLSIIVGLDTWFMGGIPLPAKNLPLDESQTTIVQHRYVPSVQTTASTTIKK